MYTVKNFRSKKELKQAVADWNEFQEKIWARSPDDRAFGPKPVTYFQPGPFGGNEPRDGTIYCEGPHYPEAHKWYAQCTVKDGVIIKVK